MKAMALTLAVYMFLGSLFPRTDFSQLPRLVFAFQHFNTHLQEERASGEFESLWDFAVKHFFNPTQHAPGHEKEHSQLPLQNVNAGIAFTLTPANWLPRLFSSTITTKMLFADQSMHSINYLQSIFRPPIHS